MRVPLKTLKAHILTEVEDAHWDEIVRKLRDGKFDTAGRKEFRAALEHAWYCGIGVGASMDEKPEPLQEKE